MTLPPHLTLTLLSLSTFVVAAASSVVVVVSSVSKDYYPAERDALLQLRDSVKSSAANLHSLWTGPPCYRNHSRWPGIACFNSHVVRLVLDGIQISGSLPPAFAQNLTFLTKLSFANNSIHGSLPNLTNLLHLEYLFLSHNRFASSIPYHYIRLPNLKKLELQHNCLYGQIPPFDQLTITAFDVSYNNLEGPIPQTHVLPAFPRNSFDHNSALCGKPLNKSCPVPVPVPVPPPAPASSPAPPLPPPNNNKPKSSRSLQIWCVALIVSAAVLLMLAFFCYYKKVHAEEINMPEQIELADRKMADSWSTEDPERTVELEFFDKNIAAFDLDDLLRASAEVLGNGNLGTTYKATLESGSVVAVKRVKNMDGLSNKEFEQQMQLVGNLRHENLVRLISFYNSKDEKLMVYEFVPEGSLFELLHENRGAARTTLNWATRASVIKNIARGLAFLHQSLASQRVPHANLKSSNVVVLIQSQNINNVQAKLTDYGFLPLLPSRKLISERLAVGRCPEFCQGKKLTHKADVYCFGIILLEIITGRIPGEIYGTNIEEDLSDWVRMVVNNDWSTDILDVEIVSARERHDEMLKLTEIALECADVTPEKRPKMSEVLRRIQEIEANTINDSLTH